ncbi:c-type cytochrome [Roseisolibacter sp. H3M3-2]|uniref:c-type cytochrome n=1 Tax=Roseisolibacter sp. H3M3-2 TaxID=3031323 RepID=UPI0023D99A56|nr:c-type cytochrome [Roseisolibacter sp. H3M3-2]MDF1501657.1 c-type cytochrome [Roseisolibacter sp. H3M3-2]
MARRGGSKGGRSGGRPAGTPSAGGRGKRRGGVPRWVVAVGALALRAAGAGASAAWLGLVPGVQQRERRPLDPDAPAAAAADSAEADTLAGAFPGLVDGTATDSAAPLDVEALLVAAADSAAGDTLWRGAGRCAGCHGAAGEGVERLGPDLRDSVWLHGGTRAAIRAVIERGVAPPKGGFSVRMPAYGGQLDAAQLARLTAFVWTLSRPGAVQPEGAPPDTAVPPPAVPPATPVPRPTVPQAP